MSTSAHWDAIYASKSDGELGWYEADLTYSLRYLGQVGLGAGDRALVVGVGRSKIIDHLLATGAQVTVNDLSPVAIGRLKDAYRGQVNLDYVCGDIAEPLPPSVMAMDLWFDRAVLHFLTDEARIQAYFVNCSRAVKPGGHALFCEFSRTGAERCAGLPVHRYDRSELESRLPGFTVMACDFSDFITPSGAKRPYINCLFRKNID